MHRAAFSTPEVTQFFIEANELAFQKPYNSECLPIHKAFSLSTKTSVIKTLHEKHPEVTKVKKNQKDFFPFHLAMTSPSALTCLHELFDEVIDISDKRGRYLTYIAREKARRFIVLFTNFINLFY